MLARYLITLEMQGLPVPVVSPAPKEEVPGYSLLGTVYWQTGRLGILLAYLYLPSVEVPSSVPVPVSSW